MATFRPPTGAANSRAREKKLCARQFAQLGAANLVHARQRAVSHGDPREHQLPLKYHPRCRCPHFPTPVPLAPPLRFAPAGASPRAVDVDPPPPRFPAPSPSSPRRESKRAATAAPRQVQAAAAAPRPSRSFRSAAAPRFLDRRHVVVKPGRNLAHARCSAKLPQGVFCRRPRHFF